MKILDLPLKANASPVHQLACRCTPADKEQKTFALFQETGWGGTDCSPIISCLEHKLRCWCISMCTSVPLSDSPWGLFSVTLRHEMASRAGGGVLESSHRGHLKTPRWCVSNPRVYVVL